MSRFKLTAVLLLLLAFNSSTFAEQDKIKFRGKGGIAKKGRPTTAVNVGARMLEINVFNKTYKNDVSQNNNEKKIDLLTAAANMRFRGGEKFVWWNPATWGDDEGEIIYDRYKDSVFYIFNPTAIETDDKIIESATGTGSLIDKTGLVITNSHVVENANQVWIYPFPRNLLKGPELQESEKFLGKIIAVEKKTDLALVKIIGLSEKAKTIPLGNLDDVDPGEKVYAIGHPEGYYTWTISDGIIGQIRPQFQWTEHEATVLQHNASISGGSSGGPLFDKSGNIIGVNAFGSTETKDINFAIAVNHLKKLIKDKNDPGIKTTTTIDPKTKVNLMEKFKYWWEYDDDKNGIIDGWGIDSDNNEIQDAVYIDEDEDGKIDLILIDSNENNSWEMAIIDSDLDGRPNKKYIDHDDLDEDDKWDEVAYDFDQDGVWDRIMPFS